VFPEKFFQDSFIYTIVYYFPQYFASFPSTHPHPQPLSRQSHKLRVHPQLFAPFKKTGVVPPVDIVDRYLEFQVNRSVPNQKGVREFQFLAVRLVFQADVSAQKLREREGNPFLPEDRPRVLLFQIFLVDPGGITEKPEWNLL
jgi:hypothetical protein